MLSRGSSTVLHGRTGWHGARTPSERLMGIRNNCWGNANLKNTIDGNGETVVQQPNLRLGCWANKKPKLQTGQISRKDGPVAGVARRTRDVGPPPPSCPRAIFILLKVLQLEVELGVELEVELGVELEAELGAELGVELERNLEGGKEGGVRKREKRNKCMKNYSKEFGDQFPQIFPKFPPPEKSLTNSPPLCFGLSDFI